jgi:protein arginine N-methyltransferase 5
MDNLENDTYEGFERDPVKYRQYEEAVYQALMERNNWSENGRSVVVFVCGAGRGPLVEGCLRASQRAQVNIELTAVEKNPNAFVMLVWLIASHVACDCGQADACALACSAPRSLQERKATQWGDAVQLVFSDMRSFTPSVQADIIVSELLGSFGDNELSPEWVVEHSLTELQLLADTVKTSLQMP